MWGEEERRGSPAGNNSPIAAPFVAGCWLASAWPLKYNWVLSTSNKYKRVLSTSNKCNGCLTPQVQLICHPPTLDALLSADGTNCCKTHSFAPRIKMILWYQSPMTKWRCALQTRRTTWPTLGARSIHQAVTVTRMLTRRPALVCQHHLSLHNRLPLPP